MSEVLESLRLAVSRLEEALQAEATDLHRDAAIQRFEFCFELSWKAIQEALIARGIRHNSPRDCIQEAWAQGWIENEAEWILMMKDRNLTVHTYKERFAREVFSRLPAHHVQFALLAKRLSASD